VTREGEKTWFQKVKGRAILPHRVRGGLGHLHLRVQGHHRPHVYWYQPKDETVHQQLLLVSEGRFDVLQIQVDANITKSTDQFEATEWSIDDEGTLTPIMQVKQKRWYESRAAVVPFQPETEMRHRRIGESHDAGHNSTSASLRLKPGSSTVSPPKAPR
jgi:hypothetical protein